MTTRTVLLSLHIASIASWLGADVMQHVVRRRWQRETGDVALAWARMIFFLHDRYYAVVAVLIVLTGVGLVFEGDWSWSTSFIWAGLATVVAGGVLGGVVLKSLGRKQVEALEAGDADAAHDAPTSGADRGVPHPGGARRHRGDGQQVGPVATRRRSGTCSGQVFVRSA